MTLADIVVYLLAGSSITIGLSTAELLDQVKNEIINRSPSPLDWFLSHLMHCPQCLGFWIGIVEYLVLNPPWMPGHYRIFEALTSGFMISTVSIILGKDLID